jgi:hypothetical protein
LHYTEKAMRRCKLGIPVATAAKRHKVPRTTLLYKKTGKYPVERKLNYCLFVFILYILIFVNMALIHQRQLKLTVD